MRKNEELQQAFAAEKEALGLYVSSHPLQDCRRQLARAGKGHEQMFLNSALHHTPIEEKIPVVRALIQDLKQRDMLDDTIILWTTEFGRMPCSQGSQGRAEKGR